MAIVTGFFIPTADAPETDGPPGACQLGDALRKLGTRVTLVTDPSCLARLRAFGFESVTAGHLKEISPLPSHLVSIERLGRARDGHYYNMRGIDLSDRTAPLDGLFLEAANSRLPTIGIGDGGNEIGMGNVLAIVRETIPKGNLIGSVVPVDHLIVAGVSNWGAWGLIAGLSLVSGHNLLPSVSEARVQLDRLVAAGVVDGVTGRADPSIDGLAWDAHADVLERLNDILARYLGAGDAP